MESEPEAEASALEQYATNLNQRAIEGKIDPLIGRELEIERTVQILCRRRKNNPLYVGEAGVGKTALAEGLARMITEERVPEVLQDSTIYALDMGSLIAGTKPSTCSRALVWPLRVAGRPSAAMKRCR